MTTLHTPLDPHIRRLAARFGARSAEAERFIKFFLVGALGTVIDFSVLNLLQATLLPPRGEYERLMVVAASLISFCTGLVSSFIWNRYWTYPDSRSRRVTVQVVQFFTVYFIGMGLRAVLVGSTYRPFATLVHQLSGIEGEDALRLGTNLAVAVAILVIGLWNFFANRYWTYGDVG